MNYTNRGIRQKQKELRSASKRVSTKILTYVFKIFITVIVVVAILGTSMGIGAVTGIINTAPDITINDVTPSQYKTTVYDCNGLAIETLVASGANRIYVTYDEIPKNLINAFIAIEDERFWTHNGIDAKGIIRALYQGISSGLKVTQGASTITQQLIKNSVFPDYLSENSLSDQVRRKVQEQYLALKLEEKTDKKMILENYLNTINLGNNNLGVQSAALNYFNKDVSELTLSECAVIAAITQNPSKYNPVRFPEYNAERREKVLKDMLEQELITNDEYNEALLDNVYDRILNISSAYTGSSAYSYYTDAMISELMNDLMTEKGYSYTQAYNLVYRGGLSIYSNEDSKLQKYAESIINDLNWWNGYEKYSVEFRFQVKDKDGVMSNYSEVTMLRYYQKLYNNNDYKLIYETKEEAEQTVAYYKAHILEETNGAIVENSEYIAYILQPQTSFVAVENGTGAVRVIVGGRGTKEQSLVLNRATASPRMAGSTIKTLLAYAPAIDTAGYGTGTVIDDLPYFWDNGALVHNHDEAYKGYITARDALADSRNIPAIKTLSEVGIMTGISYLEKFGLTTITPNDYYLPAAIGTCSVTNYEITNAYAAIANDGVYVKPKLYSKVLDHDGNVILDNTDVESKRILKSSTAWMLTEMLHEVTTTGTVQYGFSSNEPLYFAAKTGTSQDYTDKWIVGFAGGYSAGIWTGFDVSEPYDYESFGFGFINIWKEMLYKLNEGKEDEAVEAPMPDTVVAVEICKDSGLLYVEGLCDCDERGSRVATEYFAVGTEPKTYCNVHMEVTICKSTHMLAGDNCPEKRKETVIRILKDFGDLDLEEEEYEIADLKYSITEEFLEEVCTKHNKPDKDKEDESETTKEDSTE